MRTIRLTIFLLLLSSSSSFGWCFKEHIQFARLAAERLIDDPSTPADLKSFLEAGIPTRLDMAGEQDYFLHAHLGLKPTGYDTGILHWAYMPDVRALDRGFPKVAAFDAPEAKMHFIDLEIFLAGKSRRIYKPDLTSKPVMENISKDPKDKRYEQAGYLPLRIPQIYAELVKSIRENRLHPANPDDEDNAECYAGYLAHYLADNTQPQHSTVDYKSASYFTNLRKAPNAHAAMEYLMCDDETDYPDVRKEFWPAFKQQLDNFTDPIITDDLFHATLEVSMKSYDALPLIGQAAANAAKPGEGGKPQVIDCAQFFHYEGTIDGRPMTVMQMKARQTAWAVKRIERVWKQAWIEAHQK